MPPVVSRDAVQAGEMSMGDIACTRWRIGAAAGCTEIGVSIYRVHAGARQMPVHVHGDEEEIFHVLAGAGLSLQGDTACEVEVGDTIVHRAGGAPHTFLAGPDGLELIACASGSDSHLTYLPRPKVMWAGPRWIPPDGPSPFRAEAACGRLEPPPAGERPANVVALAAVAAESSPGRRVRPLGAAAGAIKSRLSHVTVDPGQPAAARHVHSLEEEFVFVLAGAGTLRLGGDEQPLVAGDAVARPPSSGVAHAVTAGPEGMTMLLYGSRRPGDAIYFPERGQVWIPGLGVTFDASAAQPSPGTTSPDS
ncbi:MAG TPA: cupin domain-containing protein [Solirubrobacteraceae bacterium]|nr:cupin domain-containing protein [Solirubrobacteraceae bacterium]